MTGPTKDDAEQMLLFGDATAAESSGPGTNSRTNTRVRTAAASKDAAAKAALSRPQAEAAILDYVTRQGRRGATSDEASTALGLPPSTVSARMSDLTKGGKLVVTDTRRRTRHGASACVRVAPRYAPEERHADAD